MPLLKNTLKFLRHEYHFNKNIDDLIIDMEAEDWQKILDTDNTLEPEHRANIEKLRDYWPYITEAYRIASNELGLFEGEDEEELSPEEQAFQDSQQIRFGAKPKDVYGQNEDDDDGDDEWDPALDNEDEDQIGREYHEDNNGPTGHGPDICYSDADPGL